MIWIDIVAVLIIVVVAWAESVRGFGRAIFDFVGGLIALKISTFLAPRLAEVAPMLHPQAYAEAFWIGALFLVMAVLVVVACKFVYESTLLSLDVLDPIVGGLLGIGSGIVVSHMVLRVMLAAYGDTEAAAMLMNSFAGQELVAFRSYHRVVTGLQNLGKW